MFCQSDLLEVRDPWGNDSAAYGPNHTAGGYNYGTLTFFYIDQNSHAGSWKVPKFDIGQVAKSAPRWPMWSCPGFFKDNRIWFDHDRPITAPPPDGGNVVFMDGHGKWVKHEDRVVWFNWYGPWYMPEESL